MAVMHESELYAPLKQFFEQRGYSIKGEVRFCDLVGMKDGSDVPLVVEIKKTFTLALLLQGLDRQKLTPNVYVAVEKNRNKKGAHNQRWSDITSLCRRLGLGFITVTLYKTKAPLVEIMCTPQQNLAVDKHGDRLSDGLANDIVNTSSNLLGTSPTRKSPKKAARLVHEFKERSGDYNVGGSYGTKLMTAYREKTLRVALVMADGAIVAPRQVKAQSGIGTAGAILHDNYYGWFERIAKGKYKLSMLGQESLTQYASVISGWDLTAATKDIDSKASNAISDSSISKSEL